MKRKIFRVISIFLVCSMYLCCFSVISTSAENKETKEYVIVTKEKASDSVLKEEGFSEKVLNEKVVDEVNNVDIIETEMTEQQADIVEQNNSVILVEENIELIGDSSDEEGSSVTAEEITWNLQMINADELSCSNANNRVKVGIIDSGINYSSDMTIKDGVDFSDEESYFLYEDISGHGTSVAGIIASENIYGINSNIDLYSIKVMNSENKTSLSKVIKGIYWSIDNDMDVINLSLGTPVYSQALEQAINDAYDAGILIIASAGNSENLSYPAGFSNVIAVGSIDNNGDIISKNSNLYENIIFAPGENIITNATFNMAHVKSGTSMAAPHITALAATLWNKYLDEENKYNNIAVNNDNINDFIKDLLFASAKNVGDNRIADLGFAQEHFSEFLNAYSPNESNVFEEISDSVENDDTLTTFKDSEVQALWGDVGHAGTIDNVSLSFSYLGENEQIFLKAMSIVPDNNIKTSAQLQTEGKTTDDNYTFMTSILQQEGNYLGFTPKSIITFADGTTFDVDNDITKTCAFENGSSTGGKPFHFRAEGILHGRGNYVASLKYLYDVAKYLYNDNSTSNNYTLVKNALNEAHLASGGQSSTFFGSSLEFWAPYLAWSGSKENETVSIANENSFSSKRQRNVLERSVYLVCNMHFDEESYVTHLSMNKRFALKVLALAIHLAGDVYAHKIMVPLNVSFDTNYTDNSSRENRTIYRGKANKDFYYSIGGTAYKNRWTGSYGIKEQISKNTTISTQQITYWQIYEKNQTDANGEKRTEYPDTKVFLSGRYNKGACQYVANLLKGFFNSTTNNTPNSFKVSWFLTECTLRLDNLKLYASFVDSSVISNTSYNAIDYVSVFNDVKTANKESLAIGVFTWKSGVVNSK